MQCIPLHALVFHFIYQPNNTCGPIQDCFVSGSKCYFIADLLFYAPANMHQTKYLLAQAC